MNEFKQFLDELKLICFELSNTEITLCESAILSYIIYVCIVLI